MYEYDIYPNQLAPLGHGYALWEPMPPLDYQRVSIADVGYIRQGCFFRLFNAALPAGHEANGDGVPENFVPLVLANPPTFWRLPRDPGPLHNHNITEKGANLSASASAVPLNVGTTVEFESSSDQGAVLITKHETYRGDARQLGRFEKYILKHCKYWLKFANSDNIPNMGHGLKLEDLMIITGYDVTSEFAMAAWNNTSGQVGIEFHAGCPSVGSSSFSVWGTWKKNPSVRHNCGPKHRLPPSMGPDAYYSPALMVPGGSSTSAVQSLEPPDGYNSCVFVRRFRIRKRAGLIPEVIKAAAGPHELGPGHRYDDYGSPVPASDAATTSEEDSSDAEFTAVSDVPSIEDPLDPLFDYILENPDAQTAIVHDKDLADLMKLHSTETPDMTLSLLLREVAPKVQVDEDGVARLVIPQGVNSDTTKSGVLPVLDAGSAVGTGDPEELSTKIANADISIAADGSFVQTTSALAARELKKYYDQIIGVRQIGMGVVRSPYAITAVQDASGNLMFRIGHRAPHELHSVKTPHLQPLPSSSPSHAAEPRRKARLDVHDLLPTSSLNSGHPKNPPPADGFSIEIRDEVTAGADAFSQVLGWSSELATQSAAPSRKRAKSSLPPPPAQTSGTPLSRRRSASTSAALSSANGDANDAPFGENVRYTAPMRWSAIFLASQPLQLRGMQSFESSLTADADDGREENSSIPKSKFKETGKDKDEAFLAAKSQARFSTTVFDVLQIYRGFPLPLALSELPTGPTIKLSATDSANPKDDPRFVIWGEIQPEGLLADDASLSPSQSTHIDFPAPGSSGVSGSGLRKRSNSCPQHSSNNLPQLIVTSDTTSQTMMIAATVERWIAQLTSELNYDELLNFLLTYRTYISPVDLCHLLICRFHWALETPSSRQDDMIRRIIRVRTFIAIRYWILTFFREDFLPNADLCYLFSTWLNALFRDPALEKHADTLSIVRKLKKIVRECKAAHSRRGQSGVRRPSMDPRSPPYSSLDGVLGDLPQGTNFDPFSKKASGEKANADNDDSDVDLDFSPEANAHYADDLAAEENINFPESSSHQSALTQPTVAIPPVHGRSSATPSANSILLSQPLSMTILGHVKSTKPGTDSPLIQIPASLPVQRSAISRAFVNTIGRLGRWKRVLKSRSSVPALHYDDASSFDLELNATGDLLAVRGGVAEYLKMLTSSPPFLPGSFSQDIAVPESEGRHPPRPPGLTLSVEEGVAFEKEKNKSFRPSSLHLDALNEEVEDAPTEGRSHPQARNSHGSYLSGSEVTDESDELSSETFVTAGWEPEIVTLTDYDLSDLSDSDSSSRFPLKVRRLPGRLPLRRDFRFVRRSIDSVSSLGVRSDSSIAESVRSGSASASTRSFSHRDSTSGGRSLVPATAENWQIELISDDEREAGDAEAALRRLEGQIDADRQKGKDMKVGSWLKTASKRPDRDDASSIHSGNQPLKLEGDEAANHNTPDSEDVTILVNFVVASTVGLLSETDVGKSAVAPALKSAPATGPASASLTSNTAAARARSGSVGSAQLSPNSRPVSAAARVRSGSVGSTPINPPPTSSPSSAGVRRRPSFLGRASRVPALSKFGSSNFPTTHRSFILIYRSEILAQQFAIIDAGLFAKVKFEELISHQWGQSLEDVDVRDWVKFVKERAKLKNTAESALDSVAPAKLSAILALRARFDLLVNFTSSEILLTHPSERVMVVEKFIRIAWKAYRHNNFNTLVSLISGLQTSWVNQVMGRHWHKVGLWEQGVLDDLKKFTSRSGGFKYLWNATTALVDARPLHPGVKFGATTVGTASAGGTSSKYRVSEPRDASSACVPFLGIYLARLYEHERLPDYIDPTAPAEPVLIDEDTGTLSSPSHPEVFSNLQALPRDLALEPLINVHKQRLIAGVIKSFVAGQHLATKIHFEVDQKCYQKCFRLRSLEPDALHRLAQSFSDAQ